MTAVKWAVVYAVKWAVVYRGTYDVGARRTRYGLFTTRAEADIAARALRRGGMKGVTIVPPDKR